MYRFPSRTREQLKHQLCISRQTAGNHGNRARNASIPAKPVWNMPLPLSTMCRPGRRMNLRSRVHQSCRKSQKFFQNPPWMMHNMNPTSNQALCDPRSLHQRAQQPCPGTGRHPKLQLRRLHSLLHDPTRAPVIANNRRVHNHPELYL